MSVEVVYFARCPEHGLHGRRTRCYECGEEAEQVPMVPLAEHEAEVKLWAEEVCQVAADREAANRALGDALNTLAVCRRIVNAQAEDDALWSPISIVEAYVVQELRALHRAVEGDRDAVAAIEDP